MTSYHRVPSSAADPSSAPPAPSADFSNSLSNHQQHHQQQQHNGAANASHHHHLNSTSSATSAHSSAAASSGASSSSSNRSNALRRTWSERLSDKIIAVLWVLTALLVAHLANFGSVVTLQQTANPSSNSTGTSTIDTTVSSDGPRVPVQWLMRLAALGIATVVLLWLYLVLYLPYVKGLTDPSAWPVYCPRIIPTMILTLVFTYVVLVRACWPVWGCLSPLIWTVEIAGLVFATHLVPWPC